MSGLSEKLKMCDGCCEDGVSHEIAGAPGAFYLTCQTSSCEIKCWYACGLCKAARLHYKADSDADRAKFAQHLRRNHKITLDIEPRETKKPRVVSHIDEPMVTSETGDRP